MTKKRRNQKEIPTPKTEVGKQLDFYTEKTYRKPKERLFPNRRSLSYPNLSKNTKTYIRFKQHKNSTSKYDFKMEPEHKYRLGTISNIKLLKGGGGLNRFYRRLTSPSSSAVVRNIYLVDWSSW